MPKALIEWTKAELLALPEIELCDAQKLSWFSSLIVLPGKCIHESGYHCMSFILVVSGVPKFRVDGYSDVVHLGGLLNSEQKNVRWRIDCLTKSKLIHVFCNKKLHIGMGFSDFELIVGEQL